MDATAPQLRSRCRSYVVIPARLASTRLPRKMLLRETGKTLIQHTYEAALRATRPMGVCVATDHEEIREEVERFGGRAVMTSTEAATGTDRVAEVARHLEGIDVVVNVQGDEPEVVPEAIDRVVDLLESQPQVGMSTLAVPIRERHKLLDPACVKVVFDGAGRALYFSRSLIPRPREWSDRWLAQDPPVFHQHLGLYAYRRDFLFEFVRLSRSPLEIVENLEQLRALAAGHTILVGVINEPTIGIDTPEDYQAFVKRVRSC